MKIAIINGPNLNLLGKREPTIYGAISFDDYFETLQRTFPHLTLIYFQSNHEGALVDYLQTVGATCDGIVINAGAYAHTSLAIADTLRAIDILAVEVHISNVYARESYRHFSYFSAVCKGCVVGLGLFGYECAIRSIEKIGAGK